MVDFSLPGSRDEFIPKGEHAADNKHSEEPGATLDGIDTPEHAREGKRVDWSLPESQEQELRSELQRVLPNANGKRTKLDSTSPPLVVTRPKSALRRGDVTPSGATDAFIDDGIDNLGDKTISAQNAQERAFRVAEDISRAPSPRIMSRSNSPTKRSQERRRSVRSSSFFHSTGDLESGYATPEECHEDYIPKPMEWRTAGLSALNLAKHLREKCRLSRRGSFDDDYSSGSATIGGTPSNGLSAPSTPKPSTTSLATLVCASSILGAVGGQDIQGFDRQHEQSQRRPEHSACSTPRSESPPFRAGVYPRPKLPQSRSSGMVETLNKIGNALRTPKEESNIRILKHIEGNNARKRYLTKLCRALMEYGAPTHRLEGYMKMSSRVLEIEAQFLYIPGCMIVSFDDSKTHTTEMKLIRTTQGVDLGKLRDTHDMYKDVVHDWIGVEEATTRLDEIVNRKEKYSQILRVFFYGVASASVGPWAFEASLVDLPIAFALGCILGFFQIYWAQRSDLHDHVYELLAVIFTSFLARMFGSIDGGNIFCFSALAQSAIALILPGYTVLCGALELQSRSIIAGSVRLVSAIIYALFLGFALTIGTALYGVMDHAATNATTCPRKMNSSWAFFFVPVFTFSLAVINKAKFRQMPSMILIAFAGYQTSYWSARGFSGNPQISSTFGALTISVIANLNSRIGPRIDLLARRFQGYSLSFANAQKHCGDSNADVEALKPSFWRKRPVKYRHQKYVSGIFYRFCRLLGRMSCKDKKSQHASDHASPTTADKYKTYPLAAAAMLPAIFVQVPSGLSVAGSLVQGLEAANQITGHKNGSSVVTAQDVTSRRALDGQISFTVGYSIVQIAIGITVGLFMGNLLVYPLGKGGKRTKMRSGLFTF